MVAPCWGFKRPQWYRIELNRPPTLQVMLVTVGVAERSAKLEQPQVYMCCVLFGFGQSQRWGFALWIAQALATWPCSCAKHHLWGGVLLNFSAERYVGSLVFGCCSSAEMYLWCPQVIWHACCLDFQTWGDNFGTLESLWAVMEAAGRTRGRIRGLGF